MRTKIKLAIARQIHAISKMLIKVMCNKSYFQSGVIWYCGDMRPLSNLDYKYWMNHPLPFGWIILVPPSEVKE